MARSIAPSPCKATDYLKVNTPDSHFLSPTIPSEIIDQTALMKNSYSKGHDDIAIRVIKHSANELSSILAEIFNQSLEQGVFPDQLKISKVVPISRLGIKPRYPTIAQYLCYPLSPSYWEKNFILDSFLLLIKIMYM